MFVGGLKFFIRNFYGEVSFFIKVFFFVYLGLLIDFSQPIIFLYAAIAFLTLFGAIFGYVQAVSGEPAWGFWGVWIGVPALLSLHLASYIGQRLARDQTTALQRRLDEILASLPVQRDEEA